MLRAYAPRLLDYIDESIHTFQNLILEKKALLFPKKEDIHDQVLQAWNGFKENCKQRNQVVNLGKCSMFYSHPMWDMQSSYPSISCPME